MSKAEVIFDKVQTLPDAEQAAVLRMVESLANRTEDGHAKTPGVLAQKFRELADIWQRETGFFSFMQQRALHPAYQRIIGMGWPVVPLLLNELQQKPDHWLWALQAITGEEPARGAATLQGATEAWVKWGQEGGLLPHGRERSSNISLGLLPTSTIG